jgi:hypothetical protein
MVPNVTSQALQVNDTMAVPIDTMPVPTDTLINAGE